MFTEIPITKFVIPKGTAPAYPMPHFFQVNEAMAHWVCANAEGEWHLVYLKIPYGLDDPNRYLGLDTLCMTLVYEDDKDAILHKLMWGDIPIEYSRYPIYM